MGISIIDVPFIIHAVYSRYFKRLQKRPASFEDKLIVILQRYAGVHWQTALYFEVNKLMALKGLG